MRVLVNDLWSSGAKTGIGHYTGELVAALRRRAPSDAIEGFPGPWLTRAHILGRRVRSLLQRESKGRPGRVAPTGSSSRRGWGAWCLGQARALGWAVLARRLGVRGERCDLYHEPNNIPLPSRLQTVVTVHDLSALLHPEWHPAHRAAEYQARFHRGLAQARHVLAVSEFTRQELIHHLGLPADRVTRTYNGVRPGLGPMPAEAVRKTLRRLRLPSRYFLYLGTIEPRKNVMTLLRAYVKLPGQVRERCPLVLAGGWGWNSGDVAAFLDGEARHRGVIYTGYLAEPDLPAVMNGARALVYPSFYEGFGLPPVEMLACGGAVLCSTAGALVETVGPHAHLLEPLDEDGWRNALARAAVDDDWLADRRRGAIEAVRVFTWERCADDTLAVYRSVCGLKTQALQKAA
jgi:alpha-1,3-rhamnosyl/mannosyltransferase